MQKVTSAYTKDRKPVGFVQSSEVLFADKKRTTRLLSDIGFQMPISCNRSGYMGSIAYNRDDVKMTGVPFSEVAGKFSLDETRDVDRLDLNPHNETGNLTEEVRENGVPEPEGNQVEAVRNGRDAGRAAGSVQGRPVRADRRGESAEGRSDGRADLGVSSVELKSDLKPHLFARALSAAIKANPNGEMVDFHDSMELSKMKRFMSENGG